MESVEDSTQREFVVSDRDIEYLIPAKYYSLEFGFKLVLFFIGLYISYFVLYKDCLFGYCNTIPTIFFAILALACFQSAGFPVEKLMNVRFT